MHQVRNSLVSSLLVAGLALPAFGATPTCSIDDLHGNRVAVTPEIVEGELSSPVEPTLWNGHRVHVAYQTGSRFDSQTSLALTVDGVVSLTYNVDPKGLYTQQAADYRLQCTFE